MRRKPAFVAVMSVLAALIVVVVVGKVSAEVQTAGLDTLRTDWDQAEPAMSAGDVLSSDFGQLFSTQLNGQVYAQPLVIGDTVIASTENDWAYGLDAATGHINWSRNFGSPWPASQVGCADLTPNIGSTGTGVYDASTGTYYVTTKVNDGPDADHPNWYLQALDPTTGAERAGWPVKIVGTPANDPTHPFAARDVNERAGLLLLGGVVYMAFGSQCDLGSYVGWVAGVNVSTHQVNLWSDETGATSEESGIWQAGGGLVSDGAGRIFLATGNGVTAPDGPGNAPPPTLSQSVVRLGINVDGSLAAQDFFSPANASILDVNDQDLGSGGPVALPNQYFGTAAFPHLMVEMGKDGRLFLLNRDNLGGKAQGAGGTDAVLQTLGPYGGQWGHPAVFGGDGGYIYVVQNSSTMLAFKYGTDGSGKPALSLAGNTVDHFGYTSGSPLVTSDGTTSGSAIVWVTRSDGPTGANGQLCAYNGTPTSGTLKLLRCFPVGTASKFSVPGSGAGRIYVGTRDGNLIGIGAPATPLLSIPQTSFGSVNVGTSGSGTIKLTANEAVTITAASAAAPFSVSLSGLPKSLAKGATLSVPATFTPTDPGLVTGVATFTVTSGSTSTTLGAALQATGVRPGFTATPATLDFGEIPVGSSVSLTENFANTGTDPETISSITKPSAAFTVTGLPPVGTVVAPGASVAVSVTYKPTATGSVTSSMTFVGPHGSGVATLTATAVTGVKKLSISPATISFGSVGVGSSATKILTVSNTGNLYVTITKAAPPAAPFEVNAPLAEGQVLAPDEELQIPVTFVPTAAGAASAPYIISSDDGAGSHTVTVTGTGVATTGTALPNPASGGWKVNGNATMTSSGIVLTTAKSQQVGSAVFSAPVPSAGLSATFTAALGGGTGADGLTFALLDASNATPSSIGAGGGGLGFSGLKGVAVALDTLQGPTDPSSNFIGISTVGTGQSLTYAATATNVPNLRSGTHVVAVTAAGGKLNVSIDGQAVLSTTVAIPATVLPAFTASTGGSTDNHTVSSVAITTGTTKLPAPGTGWRFNGAATTSGASTILTPAASNAAGSLLYASPVRTDGLNATFNLSMSGGTGADGVAFNLLAPTQPASSLGTAGGGLGFAGLSGVSVQFATYPHDQASIKFGGTTVTSTTNLPALRAAVRAISVSISGQVVTVGVDGTTVMTATVAGLSRTAVVGYSGATGGSTDVHAISESRIVTSGLIPVPSAGGWAINGNTSVVGSSLQLTQAGQQLAGSAWYPGARPTAHLDATFTLTIGGGTGADGATFAILGSTTTTSLGPPGSGLGFAGLPGVAVCFVTYPERNVSSSNFVGVLVGSSFAATSTTVPALRTGSHRVEVYTAANGHLEVEIDGTRYIDATVTLPASAVFGFTAATGGGTDVHTVSDIDIAY